MEVTPIGAEPPVDVPAVDEPTDEDLAELEAAFAEAVGSALFSLAMTNFSMLKEQLDEIGKEQ